MRRPIAIYGVTDETLSLVPILEDNPEVEIRGGFDPNLIVAREQATAMHVQLQLTDDPTLFAGPLHAVVDSGHLPPFSETHPEAAASTQVVSPLTARLLWGYGVSSGDRKHELLQALHEIVESVNLTVDPQELFGRMLEIAMSVTGADGGSLMLLDRESGSFPSVWRSVSSRSCGPRSEFRSARESQARWRPTLARSRSAGLQIAPCFRSFESASMWRAPSACP